MILAERKKKNITTIMKNSSKAVRGSCIEKAAKTIMRKEIKVNPDTQHRQNIHATIHRLVQEGNREELILNELYKTFPNSNYKEYFSKWVEDQIQKREKTSKNNGEREF